MQLLLQAAKTYKHPVLHHEQGDCHFCFSSGISLRSFALVTACSGQNKSAMAACPDVCKNAVRRRDLHRKRMVQIGWESSGTELASLIFF